MGIKNFSALLKWKAPNVKKTISIEKLKGKVIAVDAYWMIYTAITAIRASGKDFTNDKGEITSHIVVIIRRINTFLKHDILPVFVFDGPDNELKQMEIEKRQETKKKAIAQRKKAVSEKNTEVAKKLFKRTFTISEVEVESTKKLLTIMGIPWIQAPGEADIVCALLTLRGIAYGVCSDDSDMLAYGAKRLYPQFFKTIRQNEVTEIKLTDLLDELEMDKKQFVELAVLLGGPYYKPPKGVGLKTAYNKLHDGEDFNEIAGKDGIKIKKHYLATKKMDIKLKTPKLKPLDDIDLRKFLKKNSFQNSVIAELVYPSRRN